MKLDDRALAQWQQGYLGTSNVMLGPDLVLEFTSAKKITTCTLMFNQAESLIHVKKHTVLLSSCLGISSHTFVCIFVLEFISVQQMIQQQGDNYYS